MSIVTVNVSQNVGSTPNTLQRTGALISVGGTNLAANASALLTQPSDLTALLAAGVSITASSTTWATGTVTMTTATPHGYTTGDSVTVSGFAGAGYIGYNGTYVITVTGATTFTYAQATTLTTPATGTAIVTDADVAQLVAMVTTFFAQGSSLSVYVLELGHGTITAAIAALSAYLIANPLKYYRYLVPRGFDADATFATLVATYTYASATAKTYFHTTVTLSTYTNFTLTNGKAVVMFIEAAGIPVTEFTSAAGFWKALSYQPGSANQVTPYCFSYVFAVTPYPVTSTQAATFATANLNYITTGAEGGISNLILVNGTQVDGNPLNYWYSVDWFQINIDQTIAAAIINGSNNPLAPLYYNQPGVNTLQSKTNGTAAQGVANGLAVGPVNSYSLTSAAFTALLQSGNAPLGVLTNAVPFASYVALNPNDYPIGKYAGLSISYTPARGFQSIVFNINVSNFIP